MDVSSKFFHLKITNFSLISFTFSIPFIPYPYHRFVKVYQNRQGLVGIGKVYGVATISSTNEKTCAKLSPSPPHFLVDFEKTLATVFLIFHGIHYHIPLQNIFKFEETLAKKPTIFA